MKANFSRIFKTTSRGMAKHSPELLAVVGIASIVSTAALAIIATPKAKKVIDVANDEVEDLKEDLESDPERLKEEIREIRKAMYIRVAKIYWKPAASAAIGISAIIFGNRIQHRRNIALASAYAITAAELKDFKEAARELKILTKNNEQKIEDQMVKKRVDRSKKKKQEVIFTGKGEDYFIDDWSGQVFKSSTVDVEKAVNEWNAKMLREDQVTLNDLYYMLGIPEVPAGDLGFEMSHGTVDVIFGSRLVDDKAYITMGFNRVPITLY